MRVLVLGNTGMLGNAVYFYLNNNTTFTVDTIDFRWSTDNFKNYVINYDGDYIINCIGAIPQRTNSFEINYELPIWLEENASCRIIHPGTDCEIDDDDYGKSKRRAATILSLKPTRTKIIKTSLIGHELKTKVSLLDWFLNSNTEVFGYTKAMWNGVTTLQWAKECAKLMSNWKKYDNCSIISSECISKYELLNIIKQVYEKDIEINKNDSVEVNKCLLDSLYKKPIREQLIELREFYGNIE